MRWQGNCSRSAGKCFHQRFPDFPAPSDACANRRSFFAFERRKKHLVLSDNFYIVSFLRHTIHLLTLILISYITPIRIIFFRLRGLMPFKAILHRYVFDSPFPRPLPIPSLILSYSKNYPVIIDGILWLNLSLTFRLCTFFALYPDVIL